MVRARSGGAFLKVVRQVRGFGEQTPPLGDFRPGSCEGLEGGAPQKLTTDTLTFGAYAHLIATISATVTVYSAALFLI